VDLEHWAQEYEAEAGDDVWKLPAEFVGGRPCLMLFNPGDERLGFQFGSGRDVEAVLGRCRAFEFLLTDREASYVMCLDHHERAAADWLAARCGRGDEQRFRPPGAGGGGGEVRP
jgi:hypothetical protein